MASQVCVRRRSAASTCLLTCALCLLATGPVQLFVRIKGVNWNRHLRSRSPLSPHRASAPNVAGYSVSDYGDEDYDDSASLSVPDDEQGGMRKSRDRGRPKGYTITDDSDEDSDNSASVNPPGRGKGARKMQGRGPPKGYTAVDYSEGGDDDGLANVGPWGQDGGARKTQGYKVTNYGDEDEEDLTNKGSWGREGGGRKTQDRGPPKGYTVTEYSDKVGDEDDDDDLANPSPSGQESGGRKSRGRDDAKGYTAAGYSDEDHDDSAGMSPRAREEGGRKSRGTKHLTGYTVTGFARDGSAKGKENGKNAGRPLKNAGRPLAPLPEAPEGRFTGKVDRWLNLKGIGWIKPDDGGEMVFVHVRGFAWDQNKKSTFKSLREGESVEYSLAPDPRDARKLVAWDVTGLQGADLLGGYAPGETVGWRDCDTANEVYVGNLAFSTTWTQLRDYFSQVAEVKRAEVVTKGWDEARNQPFSKGWGTVRFYRAGDARKAITQLDGTLLDGRQVYVKYYEPKSHVDLEKDDKSKLLPWT